MKYKVFARVWDSEFQKEFGDNSSIHDLSDSDIVKYIIDFGRAAIILPGSELLSPMYPFDKEYHCLHFDNDYD